MGLFKDMPNVMVLGRESLAAQKTPPKPGDLTKEKGRTSVTGGVRSPHRISQADAISPARLASILKRADRGDAEAYLTLAEEIEEREGHYRSVLGTRKLGVSGVPVVVESSGDSAHETALADDIEATIIKHPMFEGLVLDLMDAVAKGFSCVEILWNRDVKRWEPRDFAFRSQRHFVFDQDTLETPRLRSEKDMVNGEALDPYSWIVHKPKLLSGVPLRGGLARTVSIIYAAKRYTVADWMAFMDVYGMPVRLGKYPAEMEAKKAELLAAVSQLGSDAAAVIPDGMTIEFLDGQGGGTGGGVSLFLQTAEYWDKQTSKVVLGQTMSSDDGASLAQSKTHERVRFDIRKADARAVASTLTEQLVRPFIDLNYGPQKVYPAIRIPCEEPEDTTALMSNVKVFVSLGGKVQMSEIRDRLGLMEPEEGAELLEPEAKVAQRGAPKEASTKPATPGTPDDEDEDEEGDQGEEDDDQGDEEPARELNSRKAKAKREKLARELPGDVVDETLPDALEDWRPMIDQTVAPALERVQNAGSYAAAREALDELARDHGEELAVDLVTGNLARATFQLRGVGAATDKTEDV